MDGLDFNQISSAFDPYKPNAPILSYDAASDMYMMAIGNLTMQVWITQGGTGEWKQRYLLKVPVTGTPSGYGRDNYVSPVQYNEETDEYVTYHPEHWWDESGAPVFGAIPSVTELAAVGRSYSKRCIGCHTTNGRELGQDSNGEWIYRPWPATLVNPGTKEQYPDYDRDGIPDMVNIGCEACHGPGSAHVLGGGDPSEIVTISELSTEEKNEICGQCHSRVKSVPSGTHGWPYRDDTGDWWVPGSGEPLADFFTDASGRWPDGITSRQHHQQWFDFLESPKPGFEYHPVYCSECHSPHSSEGKRMIRTSITDDGLEIPTANDNNTLCLACHATHGDFEEITPEQVAEYDENIDHIRNVVEAHTNHPYAPERSMGLSRCSECHMPKTAKSAVNYDIRSHTFEVIPPEKTLMYQEAGGMPNSCAVSCHALKVDVFGIRLDPDIGTWDAHFDRVLANKLKAYLGPGGKWWDTDHEKSFTKAILENAAVPGEYVPPEYMDLED
jgi:mono/diheme cytochrome c family protein